MQQGDPLPGPGMVRGTRPRASAASAVPGAGAPLGFLKTGTSLPGCIGFSEDSLGLQHVGASERCPGLAPRPRSWNFPRRSPAPVFRMLDPEVRTRFPTSPPLLRCEVKSLLFWGKGEGERHTRGEVHFSPVRKHAWRQQSRPFRRVRLLTNLWKPQLQPNPQVPQTRAGTSLGPAERTALCFYLFLGAQTPASAFPIFSWDSPLPKLRLTHPDLRPAHDSVSRERLSVGGSVERRG